MDTKGLLQAESITTVRDSLVCGGFQTGFDQFLRPLLIQSTDADIPDISQIQDPIIFALKSDLRTQEYTSVSEKINSPKIADRATSFVMHVAEYLATNSSITAAVYAAWVITKLLESMLRNKQADYTEGWECYADLDDEDESDEDDTDRDGDGHGDEDFFGDEGNI